MSFDSRTGKSVLTLAHSMLINTGCCSHMQSVVMTDMHTLSGSMLDDTQSSCSKKQLPNEHDQSRLLSAVSILLLSPWVDDDQMGRRCACCCFNPLLSLCWHDGGSGRLVLVQSVSCACCIWQQRAMSPRPTSSSLLSFSCFWALSAASACSQMVLHEIQY